MNAVRKLGLSIAALSVAGAAGIGVAYWYAVAGEAEDRLARWEAERRAEGFVINHGPIERSGFPLSLSFRTTAIDIAREGSLPVRWRTDALSARANPWLLEDIAVDFAGRHFFEARIDGQSRPIEAALGEGRVDLSVDGRGRPHAAEANIRAIDARLAGSAERYRIASLRTVARRPAIARNPGAAVSAMTGVTPSPGAANEVSLETETQIASLILPAGRAGPLGPEIKTLVLAANLIGAAPTEPTRQAMTQWRDAGGYIEIKDAQIVWGGMEIRGAGTARLGADLQPELRLDSRVRGSDALIDALVAQGQMRVQDGYLAKGVLAALSRPAEDGGAPVLRLAISVREGNRVFLGPVRIWRFPPIPWR